MSKIYLGTKAPLVIWGNRNAPKRSAPGFKDARDAEVEVLTTGTEESSDLTGDLIGIWARVAGYEITCYRDWNVVKLEDKLEYGALLLIAEIVKNREKDAWLADRYRDSYAQKDWGNMGDKCRMLMYLFNESKKSAAFGETVIALCNRLNAILQIRSETVDDKLWIIVKSGG